MSLAASRRDRLALVHQSTHRISEPRSEALLAGDVFMSSHPHLHDEDIPRFEPWLGVMASSFIPAAIGVYAHSFIAPLTVATVALLLTGLLMFRRQSQRHRAEQQS